MNVRTERNRQHLERAIRMAEHSVRVAQEDLREAQVARDEFEIRQRPEYPTTQMRLDLERAVEYVKQSRKPKSHLGEWLGDLVSVHGEQGFIMVAHGAPYGRASNGHLWGFSAPEVDRIREHLRAFGATIVTDWSHEKGHSFEVEVGSLNRVG